MTVLGWIAVCFCVFVTGAVLGFLAAMFAYRIGARDMALGLPNPRALFEDAIAHVQAGREGPATTEETWLVGKDDVHGGRV